MREITRLSKIVELEKKTMFSFLKQVKVLRIKNTGECYTFYLQINIEFSVWFRVLIYDTPVFLMSRRIVAFKKIIKIHIKFALLYYFFFNQAFIECPLENFS